MQTKPSKHKGFTLIELMIVITILSILAAIAFPAFFGNASFSNVYCNSGWEFIGNKQVLNENGGGIRCGQ